MPAEQGALIVKALEMAVGAPVGRDLPPKWALTRVDDVPAGTSRRIACEKGRDSEVRFRNQRAEVLDGSGELPGVADYDMQNRIGSLPGASDVIPVPQERLPPACATCLWRPLPL